jgi:hypothetical protein
MYIAAISIIGTLAGVTTGFLLSEFYATHRKKDHSDRLRILAKLEIKQNLQLLDRFWEKFQAKTSDLQKEIVGEDFHDTLEILAQQYVKIFVEISLPEWNRKVWESQFTPLSRVLSEDEIMQVWDLYNDLDKVSAFYKTFKSYQAESDQEIVEAAAREKDPVFFSIISLFSNDSKFQEDSLERWMECEQTISEVLRRGNPVL